MTHAKKWEDIPHGKHQKYNFSNQSNTKSQKQGTIIILQPLDTT